MEKEEFSEADRLELEKYRGKSRKRIAWTSLLFFMGITYYTFTRIPTTKLDKLSEIYSWLAIETIVVVGTYIGATITTSLLNPGKK